MLELLVMVNSIGVNGILSYIGHKMLRSLGEIYLFHSIDFLIPALSHMAKMKSEKLKYLRDMLF